MTVSEQRFLEVVPNLLRDLVTELKAITKELRELKEKLPDKG